MLSFSQIKNIMMENYASFFIFLMVGGTTAILYFAFFFLLWNVCHLHYQVAVSISYTLSTTLYFLANRSVTFKKNNTALTQQITRFLTLLLLNYVITLIIMHTAVESIHLPPYIGLMLSIGLTCVFNYTVSRYWIFKSL